MGGDVKAALDGIAKGLGGFVIASVSLAFALLLARFLHQQKMFLQV